MRALLLLAFALSAAGGAGARDLPRLKPAVTVTGDIVRIGDLIENAGAVADVAIFRAPDPGSTGTVSADRVLEAVRVHDLLLVDTTGVADVAVTRVSRAIARADIEQRVVRAFAAQFGRGDPGRFAVTFDREPRTLHVDPQAAGDLQPVRASYDARSGRFDVTFAVPGTTDERFPMARYTGTLVETVPAVVLARPLARGEIIGASDIIVERRPKSEVRGDALVDPSEAVGFAVRQPLRAGPVLRRTDVVKAEIVKRDEAVTLIYEVPGIVLTVRGKAKDSGAEGDVVNVLNAQSKRTVQGTVSGPGRVTVAAAMPVTVAETAQAAPASHSE